MERSPTLPAGYVLRRPREADAPAIERVAAASDAALAAAPTLDLPLLRQLWARPRFDLAVDAWIVGVRGVIAGYGQVWGEDATHASGFGIVHPEHSAMGIGDALATLIERRAAEQVSGTAQLLSATTSNDAAAERLLAGRGYAWARRFWQMEAQLSESQPAAAPPGDVRLRPLDVERDLPTAHRVLERAFEDHWNAAPVSYDEFLDESVHQDDFDPSLWLIAEVAGEPVGVLHGSVRGDRGQIAMLGVLRPHRGRGVASALLRASFAELRRRGLTHVRLNVDSANPTGAVSLYERLGMRVVSSYDLWSLPIEGREPSAASGDGSR